MTELVRRAQRGDRSAFEAIYREHAGRVYGLCLRLAGDPQRADEWVQDVFVRAWERIGTFRGDATLSTWLHRLAVNVVRQALRTDRRRERRVRPTATPPDPVNPSGAVLGVRLDLEQAIAGLPAGARRVFVLHDVEGYQHAEIAEILGIAAGTSKAHLHRARRLLREALGR